MLGMGCTEIVVVCGEVLVENMRGRFGDEGEKWLQALPQTLEKLSQQHQLIIGKPFKDLTYNYVTRATDKDGQDVVLKIGKDAAEIQNEANILAALSGDIVSLLLHDPVHHMLMMPQLKPGDSLWSVPNDQARTAIAAEMIAQIPGAEPDFTCDTIEQWLAAIDRFHQKWRTQRRLCDAHLVEKALGLKSDLLKDADQPALLHGDLHPFNILSTGEQWCAIDPRGVVGERIYETGCYLRNVSQDDLKAGRTQQILADRIDQLSDTLGFDAPKMAAWAFVQAFLSFVWLSEDGVADQHEFMHVALTLDKMT